MTGCTIIITNLDTKERETFESLSNLPDAKEIAEAKAAARRAEGKRVNVSIRTPRGTRYHLSPRQGNTGPGRWVWKAG